MTDIIVTLSEFDFHDLPVEVLEFRFEQVLSLDLVFSQYDDEISLYRRFRLSFVEIISFDLGKLNISEISNVSMDINSFKCSFEVNFNCQLEFVLGFGQPSWDLELTCENVRVLELESSTNGLGN